MLKKFILFFFLLVVLLFSSPAFAADWYVTQSGAGDGSGQPDLANAMSVATFNGKTGTATAGDTYYFSGTITTRIEPQIYGTSGNVITLDGYSAGDCDPVGVGSCAAAAVLSNGMSIKGGIDYITVQDFTFTNSSATESLLSINTSLAAGESDYITIRRNHLYDAGDSLFSAGRSSNYDGSDYLTIEDNRMVGYGKQQDATQGLNFYYCTDFVVKNNEFGGSGASNSTSDNVVEVHSSHYGLFEYNYMYDPYYQAVIAIKEPGAPNNNSNLIVRFNKISAKNTTGDAEGNGIYLSSESQYIYIYGNFITNTDASSVGIALYRGIDNIHVWSNIVVNYASAGIYTWNNENASSYIYIYNNTIVYNGVGGISRTGMVWSDSSGTNYFFKNNILYYNRPGEGTYRQWAATTTGLTGDIDTDYNTLFLPGQTANWYYDGAERNLATMQGTYTLEVNSHIRDPGLNDPDGTDNIYGTFDDDYTLDGTYIDDGVDLSVCFDVTVQGTTYTVCYDDALDPYNTDWTTTPPTVATIKRDDNGWDRGAYSTPLNIYDISPQDSGTDVAIGAAVSWTNPAGMNTIDFYFEKIAGACDLQIGDRVLTGGTQTSYDPPGDMDVSSGYCWRGDILHDGGTETGIVYSFTTASGPPTDPSKKATISYDSGGGTIKYDLGGMTIQ